MYTHMGKSKYKNPNKKKSLLMIYIETDFHVNRILMSND